MSGQELADLAIACLAQPVERHKTVFSTDLTVDEAILLEETGWEPRRLVMGTSIFHIGWVQPSRAYGEEELEPITRAMYDARTLATRRLAADAASAGGEVVIGVRLDVRSRGSLAEFSAIGTAIAPVAGRSRGKAAGRGYISTTHLSGQDFFLLDKAGYEPLGLVFGSCVYYVPPNWSAMMSRTNIELEAPTRALRTARELAMGRLQDEAIRLAGAGVVGVTVSERAHGQWRGAVEFLAIGTAVRLKSDHRGDPGAHQPLSVYPVIDLEDDVVTTDPGSVVGHTGE